MREVLDNLAEGVVVVEDDWVITDANDAGAKLLDADSDDLEGDDLRAVFPASVESTFRRRHADGGPPDRPVIYEEYFPDLDAWQSVRLVPLEAGGLAVYFRDVTVRRRLEETLADRSGELATLDRITRLIREIIRGLVGATSREEVEAAVCADLASTNLYELAWIAERDPTDGRLVRRDAAGDHEEVVEDVVGAATDGVSSLEATAIEADDLRVVRQLATDDGVPEPVRQAAFAHGIQSGVAVPLSFGNTVYGALGVYAAREDAFTDDEGTAFATLGETVGFAINAARQRSLLLSDTVTELSFRVADPGAALVAASRDLDCSIAVEGLVPRDDRALTCYLVVEEAGPVLDRLVGVEAVVDARAVDDADDARLLEVTVTGASPTLSLVESGAAVRTATYESGTGRIVAELAPDEDVREVVDALGEAFPDSELVAKREREQSIETARDFRQDLRDRLTDRQLTVLRTAYFADYFEYPRGSTGEELAETLGISSPTLHQHLRAAERKLLDGVFDGEDRQATHDDPAGTRQPPNRHHD